MKKLFTIQLILLTTIISLIILPMIPTFAQDVGQIIADIDGDGLPNSLEESGWYNQAGGPFITDPTDADSDNDGLSDGEEKLFGTDPLDMWNPGIYVRYKDNFLTREYFSATDDDYLLMKEGGDKSLLTEAMVARRGTQFLLGGPVSATLTINNNGLTPLTTQKDLHAGGWIINLPTNGTVGTYTATVSANDTTATLPIHVIFQLPTTNIDTSPDNFTHTLSAADVATFVYDDDPTNLRDETAVIWRTSYSKHKGWAQAFWTDQYKKYVFVDRVMPTIHGQTSQEDTVDPLAHKADEDVRVDYYNYIRTNMFLTLEVEHDGQGWTQIGSPCQSQSGALTSYLRSAGIVATPFIVDWTSTSSDYDHAVLVWTEGQWEAVRSYRGGESGNEAYKYYPFNRGITTKRSMSNWSNQYHDISGDVLVTIDSAWDWEEWIEDPSDPYNDIFLQGTVGQRWTPEPHLNNDSVDWWWLSNKPLEFKLKSPYADSLMTYIWQGDNWEPNDWPDAYDLPDPYPGGDLNENWPIEPIPQECSPGYPDTCPYPYPVPSVAANHPNLITPKTQTIVGDINQQSHHLQFGSIINESTLDTNNNGLIDKLLIAVEVKVSVPGTYNLSGKLALPDGISRYDGLYADYNSQYLSAGSHSVTLQFDISNMAQLNLNGPYKLIQLLASTDQTFDFHLNKNFLVSKLINYSTANYSLTQLETKAASLARKFSHTPLNTDSDQAYEAINIAVDLDINIPGQYSVQGNLYDSQRNLIAQSTWQNNASSNSTAILNFNIQKAIPPYTLENLRLIDANGTVLDSEENNAYTINNLAGLVDLGPITMNLYPDAALFGTNITPTQVFTDSVIDLDGDGLYDQLVIDVQLQVNVADNYRLEGWLEQANGELIAYHINNFTPLGTGLQTLSLNFNGATIRSKNLTGPYTLVALKVLGDNGNYNILDNLPITNLTLNYSPSQFDSNIIFSDDMENGNSNWNWTTPWSFSQKQWPTPQTMWQVNSNQNGTLTISSNLFNVSPYVNLHLTFLNSYQQSTSAPFGNVEVSTGGNTWTKVATYTNTLEHWDTQVVDLSAYDKSPSLLFRFNSNPSTPLLWTVDNIALVGQPGINNASFEYTPQPLQPSQPTTFVASYQSIDMTLPTTYTWDFGDGSPIVVSNNPTTTHTYALVSPFEFNVQLTVQTPYDSITTYQVVGGGDPVTDTAFNYTPTTPEINTQISFTAIYTPNGPIITATQPITYIWDFGDGNTTTTNSETINHTYTAGGNYPVELLTTNSFGTAIDTQIIEVKEGLTAVSFSSDPPTPVQFSPFELTASTLPSTASQPVTYTWHFDDGTIITTTTPAINHTFDTVGNHTVWITATNGYGGPAIVSYNNIIYVTGIPLNSVTFEVNQINLLNETEATFTASYQPQLATPPITYTWNFGDGASIVETTSSSTTHQFPDTGGVPFTYTVWVTASNSYGADVAYNQLVIIPVDTDGDGLPDSFEYSTSNTDWLNPDTDNDQLNDYEEYYGYIYTNTINLSGTIIIPVYEGHADYGQLVYPNPLIVDTDTDQLTDYDEVLGGTHPTDSDTDDDGLEDGEEPGGIDGTDPIKPDTDNDTVLDSIEVGSDPANPLDTDGDLIIDGLDTDDDNDHVLTIIEDVNGDNNAHNDDTDQDGIPNYRDIDDDGDGLYTYYVTGTTVYSEDLNNNGDPTDDNTDGDQWPNYLDADDDGDGVPTLNEDLNGDGDYSNDDTDGDGIPNYLDAHNAPSASDDNYTVIEGGTLIINSAAGLLANDEDVDWDTLSVNLETDVSNGSLTLNTDGSFTYIHNGSNTTTDSFTYIAIDDDTDPAGCPPNGCESNIATVTFNISQTDDPPIATDDTYTVNEGQTLTIPANGVLANDSDPEGNPISVVENLTSSPTYGNLTLNADGSFIYIHNGGEESSDSFTYQITDGSTTSTPATVTITINPINDAPVAVNDQYTATQADILTVSTLDGVLSNDIDVDGDSLTSTLVTSPTQGSLVLHSNGSFTYTHNGLNAITDTFTYHASDGIANSDIATVTIAIEAVTSTNTAPIANNDQYSILKGKTFNAAASIGLLANDTDNEGDLLTATLVTSPTNGILSLQSNGSFSYTHNNQNTITDTFTYIVTDGEFNSNIATVTLSINSSNQAPVANNDMGYTLIEGGTIDVSVSSGLLNNDSDADSNSYFVNLDTLGPPQHQTVFSVNPDGSFTYKHDGSETVTDTFTYQATDGISNSNTAIVYLSIIPINDPPVANDDTASVVANGSVIISVLTNDTDPDNTNSELSVVDIIGTASFGTITYNQTSVTYTHNGTPTSSDSFTYQISDGELTASATVTVSIQGGTIYLPIVLK